MGRLTINFMKMFEQSQLTSLKNTKMFPLNSILRTFEEDPATKGKVRIIESFSYLPFEGKIDLKNPDEIFTVVEEYKYNDRAKVKLNSHLVYKTTSIE